MADNAKIELERNLDHLLISAKGKGPELTIGGNVLRFQAAMPASTYGQYVKDIGTENADAYQVMVSFLRALLTKDSDSLDNVLDIVEIAGVGEIVNTVTEIYAGFQKKS